MKTNAIIRIVLFSLAIFILVGILLTGLLVSNYMFSGDFSVSTTQDLPIAMDGSVTTGAVSAEEIRSIEIEWVAGNITLQPDENATGIMISETYVSDTKYQMVYRQNGDTLEIQYCKDSISFPSFGINVDVSKDLIITVPADWSCDVLEIDAAAASVEVSDMTIREMEFDGASGTCRFDRCSIEKLDMDTASGDIAFSGDVQIVDFDGASASLVLYLTKNPSSIDIDTMSGDLELTLPSDCGFTLSMDAMSGDFFSDFPTTMQGKNYVFGDGSCRINISAMSGEVIIREGI